MKQPNGSASTDLGYLLGKLEDIHSDVRLLQQQVDSLRQESTGRRAVNKFIIGTMAIIGATVGWLVDNAVSVAQHISSNIK